VSNGAVGIVFRGELENARDLVRHKAELIAEFQDKFANPYVAAERDQIDDIIQPSKTHPRLFGTLKMIANKKMDIRPKSTRTSLYSQLLPRIYPHER
jgi:propionyl-CoA carboxylase beta chain